MTAGAKFAVVVDGHRYQYEVRPDGRSSQSTVHAPGVLPFKVNSPTQAREILRSVYHDWEHSQA